MKRKRFLIVGLSLMLVLTLLVACKPAAPPTPAAPAPYPYPEFKLRGGNVATDKAGQNTATAEWVERIYEKSQGRVKIEHYLMGKMGGQKEMEEMKRLGTWDFGIITISAYDFLYPKAAIASIPFLVQTPYSDEAIEEGWQMCDKGTWIGDIMDQAFEEYGVFRYLHGEGGFYSPFFAKKFLHTPDDFKGEKIRIGLSPLWKEWMDGLGVIGTSIPWGEIYTGLEHGTFDGMWGNMGWPFNFKFHEVGKYITLTPMVYANTEMTWSKKCWDTYPEWLKELLLEEQAWLQTEIVKRERASYSVHREETEVAGTASFYTMTPEEIAVFTKLAAEAMSPYVEKVWGKEVLEKIKKEYWKVD